MTVKQLIKELSKVPEDAQVMFHNNDLFLCGYYAVTSVDVWEETNEVDIVTDHKKLLHEED